MHSIMSEQVDSPAFTPLDIHPNASENDAFGLKTTITEILFADIEAYGNEKPYDEYGHDLTAYRREMMKRAESSICQNDHLEAIRQLKWVLEDLDQDRQLNQVREFQIRKVMEECYKMLARKTGATALAEVTTIVPVSAAVELPIPAAIVESLAS
jgi:hypothetical protein